MKMVNEHYFFWSGLATAALVLGVGIAYRWARQGGSKVPTPTAIYKKIKKGETVRIGDFIVAFRDSPKILSLSPAVADKVRAQLKSDLQGASEQRSILPAAERLLEGAIVANRKFERFQISRRTEFNEEAHGEMLKDLWNIAFGADQPYQRLSEKWGRLGFQGVDPQTDFRGGGVLALEQLHYFANRHRQLFLEMIAFNDRQAELKQNHWFLLAVVSIQFTVQIATGEHPIFPQHLNLAWEDPYYAGRSPNMIREGIGAPNISLAEPALDGFHELHAALMKEFFKQWMTDLPHVMSYTQWIPKVYATFFNPDAVLK